MKRKHNDTIKPGCGIDGGLGEDFTKRSGDPWDSNPRGNYKSPRGAGAYQDGDASFLTNKFPDENRRDEDPLSGARDILAEVEANQPDTGNRAIRSRDRD
jgi:hypothetical protein